MKTQTSSHSPRYMGKHKHSFTETSTQTCRHTWVSRFRMLLTHPRSRLVFFLGARTNHDVAVCKAAVAIDRKYEECAANVLLVLTRPQNITK